MTLTRAEMGLETAESLVRVQGIIQATEADMELVNRHSIEPLAASDVYVINPAISTQAMDSYFTRMSESSIRNYAADAAAGNPLMTSHITNRLAVGKSFASEIVEEGEGLCVRVKDYFLKGYRNEGIDTDQIARGIQAGIHTDMSIWFGGASYWYRCGLCNQDVWDSNCPHVPGVLYGDLGRAWAWVEDARLIEHSLVFSGSTPGAIVAKARMFAEAGRIEAKEIQFLEDKWRTRLSGEPVFYSLPKQRNLNKEDGVLKTLIARLRALVPSDKFPTVAARVAAVQVADTATDDEVVAAVARCFGDLEADASLGSACRSAGIPGVDAVPGILARAKDGDTYRTDLVAEALAEGVRAKGESFDKDFWTRLLSEPGRSISDIKAFRDQFAADAKARLANPDGTGGRQVPPADPNTAPSAGGEPRGEKEADEAAAFLQRTERK